MSKEIHYRLVSQREERHVIPGGRVSLHGEPDGGTSNTSFTATPSSSADQSTTSQRRARSRTAKKGRSKRTPNENHSARRIVGQASAASSNTATPGEADRSRHSPGRSRQPKRGHRKRRSSRTSTASTYSENATHRSASRGRSRTTTARSASRRTPATTTNTAGSSNQTSAPRKRTPSRGRRHSRTPKRRQRKSRSASSISTNNETATHSSSRSRSRVSTARSSSRSRLSRHVSSNRNGTNPGLKPTSDSSESSDQSSVHRGRSASRGRKRKRSKRRHHKRRPSPNVSTASSTRPETSHRSPYECRSRTSTARLPSTSRLHRIGPVTGAHSRPTPMTSASAWSRATSESSAAPSVHERAAPTRHNNAVRQLFQSDHHSSTNASFQPTPFRPLAQSTPYVKAANNGANRPASAPPIPARPTSAPPIPPRPPVAWHSGPHGSSSNRQHDWHVESVSCEVDGVDVENRPQSKIIKVRSSTSLVLRSPSEGGQGGKGPQRARSRDSTVSAASHQSVHSFNANDRASRPWHEYRSWNPQSRPRYVPPNPNDPRRSAMSRVYHRYFAGLRPAPPVPNEALIHGFMDPQNADPLFRNRAVRRLSFTSLPGSTATSYQQHVRDSRRNSFDPLRPASAPPLEFLPKLPAKSGIRPTQPRYVPPNPNDPRRSAMSRVYHNYFAGASGDSHDFNPVTDKVPPINLNVSGSFFDASHRLSGWSGAPASISSQSPVPTADSWDLNAFNARLNSRNSTRQLSFGDDVPSSNTTGRMPSGSRLHGFMVDADPHDEPLPGNRAMRRLSFSAARASPSTSSQQHVQDPRPRSLDPYRPASAPPLESLQKLRAKSGVLPTRPRYVSPNPNDPRRSAMSRVYRNYFAGLKPAPPAPNEALTLYGFVLDAEPHEPPTRNAARSAPPLETRPKSPANSGTRPTRPQYVPPNPSDPRRSAMSRVYLNQLQARQPQQLYRSQRLSVSPSPADHRPSPNATSSLQLHHGEMSGQWNTGARDVSVNGQPLARSMSRLSLDDNRCVFDGPVTAYSNLKIQVDRKKNTIVLTSRLVLNSADRTKSTTKLTSRTRELPGNVVSTCEKTKQRNDGQAKTEQNIQIEKDKIVIERKTRLKGLQAGSDYTLEDTGTCRNVCRMRMMFGNSSSEGELNLATGVLISKDATGRVVVREMTRLYIGDAKESTSALVPLESTVEVNPSIPLCFDENVQVGRSTIEIAREVRLDPQLIGSLTARTNDSGLEEQRVYVSYEGPTTITPMRSSSSLSASRRSIETERTQASASSHSVASSIHEHPYHGLAPRRSSSDAIREMVASTPGTAGSDTMNGAPDLSSDSLSDSSSRSRGTGQQSYQKEGSTYLDVQLQASAPSALHSSSPLVRTAVAKSCHSGSERTARSAHSASSGTHFSDKSDEQRSDRNTVVTAVSPSAQNVTVRSAYAGDASPASSQFVSPQPSQATPSRTGNGTHLLYHTFNLPDVYMPNSASQIHEHRRVVQLQMLSNGEPLTVDLHATFRTRQPVLTLNLTAVSLDSKRLWQK